jgi:hypothetical protein
MTMRRSIAMVGMVAALAGGAATGIMVAGAEENQSVDGASAVSDPSVPAEVEDRGEGEYLILVVGGTFATHAAAEAANASLSFGDLQGYYVAERSQFGGVDEFLGADGGDWLLVSAFRTEDGAREFADLARGFGAPALVTGRIYNGGNRYVGLGQESAPDGSGPQRDPIPGVTLK